MFEFQNTIGGSPSIDIKSTNDREVNQFDYFRR